MKLLVALCLVAVVAAAPPPRANYDNDVQVVRQVFDNTGFGGYKYGYEQSDGTRRDETGEIKNEGLENESLVVKGSFSWVVDGITYTVTYVADENGYQPEIEQGPGGGVPPAVVASLLG